MIMVDYIGYRSSLRYKENSDAFSRRGVSVGFFMNRSYCSPHSMVARRTAVYPRKNNQTFWSIVPLRSDRL
jgi:hypothetical protein